MDYQTLCAAYREFKYRQQHKVTLLRTEADRLCRQLALRLGLFGKYYAKTLIDDNATEPYVFVELYPECTDGAAQIPELRFDLKVVLENAPHIYPKTTLSETLIFRLQNDELHIRFADCHSERYFQIDHLDDGAYRPVIETYLALLTKQLSR